MTSITNVVSEAKAKILSAKEKDIHATKTTKTTTVFGTNEKEKDVSMTTEEFLNQQSKKLEGAKVNNSSNSSVFTLEEDDNKNGEIAKKTILAGVCGTASALAKYNQETTVEYDQESIDDALWKYGDNDENGYLSQEEYSQLMLDSVVGVEKEISGLIKYTALGALGAAETIANKFNGYGDIELNDMEIYSKLKEIDAGIDVNGDGNISRDEFNTSVLTRLTTDPDGSLYGEDSEEC